MERQVTNIRSSWKIAKTRSAVLRGLGKMRERGKECERERWRGREEEGMSVSLTQGSESGT
jgi:hypothetical protein